MRIQRSSVQYNTIDSTFPPQSHQIHIATFLLLVLESDSSARPPSPTFLTQKRVWGVHPPHTFGVGHLIKWVCIRPFVTLPLDTKFLFASFGTSRAAPPAKAS